METSQQPASIVIGDHPEDEATTGDESLSGAPYVSPVPSDEELAQEGREASKIRAAQLRELGEEEPQDKVPSGTDIVWLDPMEAFLTPKAKDLPEDDYPLLRLKTKVRVRAIPTARYKKLVTDLTRRRRVPETGEVYETVDQAKLKAQAIVMAAVNVDFRDARLLEFYKALDAEGCVERMLLPGEIDNIYSLIGKLSGFDSVFLEEAAKNS
jgi:hypothetical protein